MSPQRNQTSFEDPIGQRTEVTTNRYAGVMSAKAESRPPLRLERQVLRDDVYRTLVDMLLDDQVRPGQQLSIEGLARDLGVSPTPVREALVSLEHSGLVARTALKGYRVAPRLDEEQTRQLIEARSVVELAAIGYAMNRPDELLEPLRAAHEGHLTATSDMIRAGVSGIPPGKAIRTYFEADLAFHLVLVEASGNAFITQMFESLGAHLHRMVQSAGRGVLDWEAALSEHGVVLNAIEAGDASAATGALRRHLDGVQQRALAEIRSNPRST